MQQFKTDQRLNKIKNVISQRQPSLTVVLENIHDPHNVSAIYRTCDSVGVQKVSLLYNIEKFPRISKVSSSSANKWINTERSTDTKECYEDLRRKGFRIYASLLSDDAVDVYSIDMTEKAAFVFGNESRGVSEEAAKNADEVFYIPMRGMIQSLNVSVAAAVTLYEAQRQRTIKGMYEKSELSTIELDELIDEWCER
ncbi:MAG: TrmH family RNA methyltransferase [Bacteroidota bacterium]